MNVTSEFPSCFPRASRYRENTADLEIRESSPIFGRFSYQERHLQCLWANPRLRPKKLKTTESEVVQIEHPGDWNLEAGPDFLNATLLIGKEKRRITADLEIHIHANGWNQHGHANDHRFRNVRFHVVYFQGIEIPGLIQIPLQKIISTDSCFSFDNIDITAYPYSIPSGFFPLKTMDPDKKTQWLECAGEERLRLKAERLAHAMQTKEPEQILWEELLSALGYKNNKAPFRKLATLLPLEQLRSKATTTNEAYTLLLGLSGLLPPRIDPKWSPSSKQFIRTLWDFWWKQPEELKEDTLNKSDWNLSGLRPANHPVRRLMAAAYYAFSIIELIQNNDSLTVSTPNHWTTHISWRKECKPTALVGRARANAIITNILIPFQAATGSTKLNLEKLPPEPSNSIIRQTAYTLFGPDHTSKVYKSALARQGLIQIFHDYLITHRLHDLK